MLFMNGSFRSNGSGRKAVLALFLALGFFPAGQAAESGNPSDFPSRLPSFTLADPDGKNFTPRRNSGNVTVVIVTIPDMSQGGVQKKWVKSLSSLSTGVNYFLIEDMKGTMFQGIALSDMKNDYAEGDRPVVLIDQEGAAAQALAAPRGKTVVYVFDSRNRLVHVQIGHPSAAAVQNVRNAVASAS